jgi:hypothetical protein
LNIIAPARYPFLSGGGEAAEIIASFDWAATPLGPIESWPASLKSTIALILRSPVPIVTLWGEDGIMIYNDGYSAFAGGRHPNLFGSKVREGWPEVADFNDNIMKLGLAGETLAYRDFPLTLYRHGGEPEQVWLNLDYSLSASRSWRRRFGRSSMRGRKRVSQPPRLEVFQQRPDRRLLFIVHLIQVEMRQ